MAQIRFEDLKNIREKHKEEKIVFCSGCFDLTHAGHLIFFEDCKRQGDILVVMIGADEVIKRNKGPQRPIVNEHMRLKLIESLKPVDYIFIDRPMPPDAHPLEFLHHVFASLKPDVYVINTDAFNIPYREQLVQQHGTELVVLERNAPEEFRQISTTSLIKRIKELE